MWSKVTYKIFLTSLPRVTNHGIPRLMRTTLGTVSEVMKTRMRPHGSVTGSSRTISCLGTETASPDSKQRPSCPFPSLPTVNERQVNLPLKDFLSPARFPPPFLFSNFSEHWVESYIFDHVGHLQDLWTSWGLSRGWITALCCPHAAFTEDFPQPLPFSPPGGKRRLN